MNLGRNSYGKKGVLSLKFKFHGKYGFTVMLFVMLLLFLIFVAAPPAEDELRWNKTYDLRADEMGIDIAYDAVFDSQKHLYVVGEVADISSSWMLKRYDALGVENLSWNKSINYGSIEKPYGVAVDSQDNVYVAGYLTDSMSLSAWHIKKYYPNASEEITEWNKTFWDSNAGNVNVLPARGIAVDSQDNIYVVGYGDNLVSNLATNRDWWIKRFNRSGTENTTQWNKSFNAGYDGGMGGRDFAYAAAVDSQDSLYVVGSLERAEFVGTYDWWMKKFYLNDSEEVTEWNKTFRSVSSINDEAYSVAVDSQDNVYVAGYSTSNNSAVDRYWVIKKYNRSGTEIVAGWDKVFNLSEDLLAGDYAYDVGVDFQDNVYVVGSYFNPTTFNFNWLLKMFNSSGTENTTAWNKSYSFDEAARGIAIQSGSNNVTVVGASAAGSLDWQIKLFTNNLPQIFFSGNVTMQDITDNSSATFNFSNQSFAGAAGYIRFDNITSYESYVEAINGAQLLFMGFFSSELQGDEFRSNFLRVPNSSYRDNFINSCYGCQTKAFVNPGDAVAFLLPDNTSVALYVKNLTVGSSITFEYKFHSETNNATLTTNDKLSGCILNTTIDACFTNPVRECQWLNGICLAEDFFEDHDKASCRGLPPSACGADGFTNPLLFYCSWDATAGTQGLCVEDTINFYNSFVGYNCTAIVENSTFCENQGFTQGTGLCSWDEDVLACVFNRSKTLANLPSPPVSSCEARGYVNNQSGCGDLANLYFLPCGWNNKTSQCETRFLDFTRQDNFDDITSEDTCDVMGGLWKQENTFDPVANKVTAEKWCEFNVDIKTFAEIGPGSQNFGGDLSQLRDCSRDCFACEYQSDGTPWTTLSDAQVQCQNSAAGCLFQVNTNAFNGLGWCVPAQESGGFDCDEHCGDCNIMPNPQPACQNSSAVCKWDNVTNFCIDNGVRGCNQDCFQCNSQTTCTGSPANGGCQWDLTANFCTPRSGEFEVCFDALDNDNNGQTDCNDFKCTFDPFCGGDSTDPNNCFQYDIFSYGSPAAAQTSCTAVSGCSWFSDDFGFASCKPSSFQCWENQSMEHNQTACTSFLSGSVCSWKAEDSCELNSTMLNTCSLLIDSGTCNATAGCTWDSANGGVCAMTVFVRCTNNASVQTDQAVCETAGCLWRGNEFSGGFEGFQSESCVDPCTNGLITTQADCTANGTAFGAGTCLWTSGYCKPVSNVADCFQFDGDINSCTGNPSCQWVSGINNFGALRHPSPLRNDTINVNAQWMAIGLTRPGNQAGDDFGNPGGYNASFYFLNATDGSYLRLEMSGNLSPRNLTANISRIVCGGFSERTIMMEYNYTNSSCMIGTCNAYAEATCNGTVLHYFFNSTTIAGERISAIEALWEIPVSNLYLDATDNLNYNVSDTTTTRTVIIDGNRSNYDPELTDNLFLDLGWRVRTRSGMCEDKSTNTFFAGIDKEPPVAISSDGSGDIASGFLDITGLGMKKMDDAYSYGIMVRNLSDSMICKGVAMGLTGATIGNGTNTSKYYLYLDTNDVSTGGCAARDDATKIGFEYNFKYIAELDTATSRLKETLLAEHCSSGNWVSSNVPVKSNKQHGCGFVGGPILAIDKEAFTGKSDVNVSAKWRAYATSAGLGGNASNITDSVGPGSADFKGINVEIFDCTSTASKDKAQCSKFKQFGFFPGEFGPACKDNIDNDGDDKTDCNDLDCAYDPFFCGGSFTAVEGDESAPSIVWNKINNRLPTQLSFIFDTNEPANGTVKYYYNDSRCSTLNATINDSALNDGDSHTNFRPHHVADVTGLNSNVTYFYKLNVCDPSGNCAVTACNNATTSFKYVNITFKFDIPDNWTLDIPSLNLSNYTPTYALKASTQLLTNVNITINDTQSARSITLVGIDIFEKQTLNISSFFTGTELLGMDANQYQAFKQKTGLDKAIVSIPTSDGVADTVLQHCDDSGSNCQDVTSKVTCTFSATETECLVPDAVGLGFSTYKSTTSTGSSSSTTSGTAGRGSSGGGGTLPNIGVKAQPAQQPAQQPSRGGTGGQAAEQQQEAQQQAPVAAGGAEAAAQQPAGRAGPSALAGLATSVGKVVGKVGWVIVLFAAVVVITIVGLTWYQKKRQL